MGFEVDVARFQRSEPDKMALFKFTISNKIVNKNWISIKKYLWTERYILTSPQTKLELTQNITLNPKITYFKQQLTSLVSLLYFLTGIFDAFRRDVTLNFRSTDDETSFWFERSPIESYLTSYKFYKRTKQTPTLTTAIFKLATLSLLETGKVTRIQIRLRCCTFHKAETALFVTFLKILPL